MARDGLGVAPAGRYHPSNACWYCGADLDRSGPQGLDLVVVKMTHAYAWQCVDRLGCDHRRFQARQLGLFGPEAP